MGNGDAFEAKEVPRIFGKPVAQFIDERRVRRHAKDANPVRASGEMQHRAGKGHVPDIPDIHIDHARHARYQHDDIHGDSDRDGNQRNLRCPCHR